MFTNLFARLSARFRGGGDDGGYRACYGIVVCCVSMLLFCVIAASVSVWKAFAFTGLAAVAFGVAGCVAPESWCVGLGAGAEPGATAEASAPQEECQLGLAEATIDALPTFAYASRGAGEGGDHDLESGSDELCSVCLEDMQAGEMVRQLPACKHLFHVLCVVMWLHSHRTCPICRCDLPPPPRKATAKAEAVDPEPAAAVALPPV